MSIQAAERPAGGAFLARIGACAGDFRLAAVALEAEWRQRRFFLWLPVCAGAGACYFLLAARDPDLAVISALAAGLALLAFVFRRNHLLLLPLAALAAFFCGELCGVFRAARVGAPVLPRIVFGDVAGFVEEVDYRANGARFVLRVTEMQNLQKSATPFRLRLSMPKPPDFAAGDFITVKARVLPPAHAALPGGYDFARDAFFAGIGGVGNLLGAAEISEPPEAALLGLRVNAWIDRARNALALRVYEKIGGDDGAIAAAMVTGKRDLLSDQAKETIRLAGIFHIVTISGVQMTLVAGIFFVGLRGLLARIPFLALNFPIKKISAGLAMAGASAYAIFTGSRVGSDGARALHDPDFVGRGAGGPPRAHHAQSRPRRRACHRHRTEGAARREFSIVLRGGGGAGRVL